uniref:Heme-binding protein 1 n=1 Tax=Acanthochromis polyacanthus TaxID=80966 RepID=A0A3Q1FNG4_9TELE
MFGMVKNSLFGNTEETEYKLLSSETKDGVSFEVRRYDAFKYAAVSSEGRTFDQVTGELIRKLLMYIGGSNEQGEAMGTAAPIIITVYPRNDGVLSRRLVVGIRIPTDYQQSPPTPTDSAVRIEERPGMTVYALQFGGFAGESEYRAEALRLTRTLGETAPFQRKQYFCCSFDPPLKPYGRRNEGSKVVIPLQVQLTGEDRWIRVNISCSLIKRRDDKTHPTSTSFLGKCDIKRALRINCGPRGISSDICNKLGCCYDAVDLNCYYKLNCKISVCLVLHGVV